jgi:hypothetical protein
LGTVVPAVLSTIAGLAVVATVQMGSAAQRPASFTDGSPVGLLE